MNEDRGWAALLAQPAEEDTSQDTMNKMYARVFSTTDGQKVVEHLRQKTLDQPCFLPGSDSSYGYAREGQNSIVREIENRIKIGRQK
jgi:hypothetical protein